MRSRLGRYQASVSPATAPPCRRHRPRARTLEGLFFNTRHNRSQSYRGSSARSDIYDDLDGEFFRPRVSTMPNASANPVCSPGEEQHFYLARNFQTNSKGKLVNCGDCYREGSRSNTSVNSSSSNKSSPAAVPAGEGNAPLRVMMLGGVGVGKSSLVSQFMSSEFVNAYEYSCGEYSRARSFVRSHHSCCWDICGVRRRGLKGAGGDSVKILEEDAPPRVCGMRPDELGRE